MEYQEALNIIKSNSVIDFESSFKLAEYCSKNSSNKSLEFYARDILIRTLDSWERIDSKTYDLWNDLIEVMGLYPYLDAENLSTISQIRYEFHKSKNLSNFYFHEEQREILFHLNAEQSVIVSAPTSFGKSLLIEEIVASKKYRNIVIIQPTLALLDETRKKLQKYSSSYKLLLSTSQKPIEDLGNIFLFTGERVAEYNEFKNIEFFIIDEFYKLSMERDDERAIILNIAFNKLLTHTKNFYMLGPVVRSIPLEVESKFNIYWFPTKFSTVSVDEEEFKLEPKLKAKEKKKRKKEILFEFLKNCEESTMIYCASPEKATILTLEYLEYLNGGAEEDGGVEINSIIEWIRNNIHQDWGLVRALKNKIAFHHGALPRHLGSSIIELFNRNLIKFIFCTSTIIEGVNTAAKNVVLFDQEKGRKSIDYFDYRNIAGRSGRMNQHFIGKVYRFDPEPEQFELELDFPIITQIDAPLEILINIDERELKPQSKEKLANLGKLEPELKGLLQKGSGFNVEGQLNLIKEIENNLERYNSFLNWSGYPTYEQLDFTIDLGFNYLLRRGDNRAGIRSPKQLTFLTHSYRNLKSIEGLIVSQIKSTFWQKETDYRKRVDQVIFFVLNVMRRWFDFKLPKMLTTLSDIQEYIFSKNDMAYGDYSFFATQLENNFLDTNYSALLDYDIPRSAIIKTMNYIETDSTTEQLITFLADLSVEQLKEMNFLDYEINKILSLKG